MLHREGDLRTIQLIDDHLNEFFGKGGRTVFHETTTEEGENHIDVYLMMPNIRRRFTILLTCGMSRYPMNIPDDEDAPKHIELMMLLPWTWWFGMEWFPKEKWMWPILHLKACAKIPTSNGGWVGPAHTVTWDLKGGCFPGTGFNSSLICYSTIGEDSFTTIETGQETIQFLTVIPLYPEELEFKLANGANPLLDKFDSFKVSEVLDPKRKNTCK